MTLAPIFAAFETEGKRMMTLESVQAFTERERDIAVDRALFMNSSRRHGPFSTNDRACREMEDEINRRGGPLQHAYSIILPGIVSESFGLRGWKDWRDTWAIIRATPA